MSTQVAETMTVVSLCRIVSPPPAMPNTTATADGAATSFLMALTLQLLSVKRGEGSRAQQRARASAVAQG